MKQDMPERSARTVLAFDFGLKRIGVAVGEPELRTAHPLPAISAPGFDTIGKLVAEWHPAQLVVGLPVAANGEHPLARRVEAPNQVHQRGLARPRRPHDRDILAAFNLDGHPAQGVNLLGTHDVGFPQIDGFN